MDPVTHTFVGLALGKAGLERRSRLATGALVIGSSLPDVDVISLAWGGDVALAVRRGITHGIPALLVWPFVLTAALAAWHRWRPDTTERPRVFRPRAIFWVSALAIWLHPSLDYLNNYGLRWLMPLSGEWFYGDTLFIVEPVLLGILVAGVVVSRRGGRPEVARRALALACVFIGLMGLLAMAGRRWVSDDLARAGIHVEKLMVSPVAGNPLRRFVVAEDATGYYVGELSWVPRRFTWRRAAVDKRPASPLMTSATRGPASRNFLGWARFPCFAEEHDARGTRVVISDLRYADQPGGGFATVVVEEGR